MLDPLILIAQLTVSLVAEILATRIEYTNIWVPLVIVTPVSANTAVDRYAITLDAL